MRPVPVYHHGAPVGPNHDREVWKRHRIEKIGSSDSGTIFGLNEYDDPASVWDRIVLGEWPERALGADIRRGQKQEPVAIQTFTERTGLDVKPVTMLLHGEDARICTDVDGVIQRPDEWPPQIRDSELWSAVMACEGPGALEVKVPQIANFYRTRDEGLSRARIVQHQHHFMVTGFTWGFFVLYTAEYDDMIAFPVTRDPWLPEWLFQNIQKWYDQHVVTKVRPERPAPPPPRWPDPIPGEATHRDDAEWTQAAESLVVCHHEAARTEAARARAEGAMAALLRPDDRHVAGGGVVVKRYSTTQQTRKDAKAYQAAVKLAQKEGRLEDLARLKPEDFTFKTSSSEKVEVKVLAADPMAREE